LQSSKGALLKCLSLRWRIPFCRDINMTAHWTMHLVVRHLIFPIAQFDFEKIIKYLKK
jgi:hypothetical protein